MPRLVIEDNGVLYSLDGEQLNGMPPPPPNGPGPEEWVEFTPRWRVGASGGLYADPGDAGSMYGWYKEKEINLIVGGGKFPKREIEIFIELEMISPNIPEGEGLEFELPEDITPENPRTGRGGGGDLWILGGANHYSISPKWTDRNNRPMRLLILLGDGREWTRNVPKEITEKGSLYFWMKYLA